MDDDPRVLTTLALLKAVQFALNAVPRKVLRGLPEFKDTYALAAEVDRHVEWHEENKDEEDE